MTTRVDDISQKMDNLRARVDALGDDRAAALDLTAEDDEQATQPDAPAAMASFLPATTASLAFPALSTKELPAPPGLLESRGDVVDDVQRPSEGREGGLLPTLDVEDGGILKLDHVSLSHKKTPSAGLVCLCLVFVSFD